VADANKQRSIPGHEWSTEIDPEVASRGGERVIWRPSMKQPSVRQAT
jgi:hypothetical protein